MTDPDDAAHQFDFEAHAKEATNRYRDRQRHYEDCASAVEAVLVTALKARGVQVHSVESRAKTLASFERKAGSTAVDDPEKPKYQDPIAEITDLAGVRVITFFLDTVDQVSSIIESEFEILEKTNKSSLLAEEERLGYQSIHFLISFSEKRTDLPEYSRFAGDVVEIQVRTILQHAWAEIEHDIQYKSVEALPATIRRRFLSLAGLLEIGDREFQAIAEEDRRVRLNASRLIREGKLDQVELTPDALKVYLDSKFGPDGRMGDWNYGWNARTLRRFGFENLRQIDDAISNYDDDRVSRAIWGSRQGQLQRFEDVLMAAMGDTEIYYAQHPWAGEWFTKRVREKIDRLAANGIPIGSYDPRTESK